MERAAHFKRMVLGLPHSATDYASVAFTAQLAELLGLDIVGLFVEDENLTDLAALPCVRELRSLGGGWHPIDAAQLAQGTGQAAADARRRFEEAAKALRVGTRFNLARGMMADIINSQSTVDDIIAIIEPKNPAERVTHQYRQLMDVAFNAPSATLLVPSHISRRTGPIIAIATSGQDPSIDAALGIATSIKERLIVLAPPEADKVAMARLAGTSEVAIDWRSLMGGAAAGAPELASLLSRTNERFVVLSRGRADDRRPSQLASGRGVPVLVTEPAAAERS
jgi:hypothetical protein